MVLAQEIFTLSNRMNLSIVSSSIGLFLLHRIDSIMQTLIDFFLLMTVPVNTDQEKIPKYRHGYTCDLKVSFF